MSSLFDCIPWMTVGLAECVAIVTLNLCTIIVYIRNRNLHKRSTCLVINLAVIDMFVGGVVAYILFYGPGADCYLWEWHSTEYGTFIFIVVLLILLPSASLTSLTIIALERVHATFLPFRHRVLKKWVYGLMIAVVWVISVFISVSFELLILFEHIFYALCLRLTLIAICLLIICVCYTSIVIKIRCGTQPQHHGAASRERKLTMTLLIVTVVSLLLYLPYLAFYFVITSKPVEPQSIHLHNALWVLFFANSLVNPILYAIRMPEYRSAFLALFRRRAPQQRQVAVLPLRNM